MTKKHYIAIAAELQAALSLAEGKEARKSVERIAEGLANIFANDNPRFEKRKFMVACGIEE